MAMNKINDYFTRATARYEADMQARQNDPSLSIDILAIESSCDETAAAVIRDGHTVLSSVVASQIESHQRFGGVVPEVASRAHVEQITLVIEQALQEAEKRLQDMQAIAVTFAPGLIGALFVGVTAAKSLALAADLPLLGVHHLAGHLYASAISDRLDPPFVALIVSGGHTELLQVTDHGVMVRLGHTRDDAAGEAFDKVSRALGLGYPDGPAIEQAAKAGNPTAFDFPRALLEEGSLDFSVSGLKSAVLLVLDKYKRSQKEIPVADLAASFQMAVVDILVQKALLAIQRTGHSTLVIAGGVAANCALRERLSEACCTIDVRLVVPDLWLCTDNAAMVGAAAYYRYQQGKLSHLDLTAIATLPIDAW